MAFPAAFEQGSVFLVVFFVALPLALIAAAGAGRVYEQVGRGIFSLDQEELPQLTAPADNAVREAEVRQMLEAKSFRAVERGEQALDIDAEVKRLLAPVRTSSPSVDAELVEEVRQLVVARNARRAGRGEEPLDVDAEVRRQLRELENLGQ